MILFFYGKQKILMEKIISIDDFIDFIFYKLFFLRHTRVNIEFGQANHVAFSPDGK